MSENTMNKYLLFEVDEVYALSLDNVVEIIEMTEVTRVPEAPDYIAGIINLRGHVVPLLDIRKRFRKPPREDAPARCIVIARIEENQLGLMVDNVIDLIDIAPENLKEPPQVGSSYTHVFIGAIGILNGQMHLIIDTDKLVNYADLNLDGEETATAAEEP